MVFSAATVGYTYNLQETVSPRLASKLITNYDIATFRLHSDILKERLINFQLILNSFFTVTNAKQTNTKPISCQKQRTFIF